ncbi:transmembrane anterior posterior transformation protein 1-like isoform X2 [Dysidea avara]|uniref:transmembrane anterior posterior transformation protein 1-like isoform X2 n=1 Tax=Dysidea avara TaxID=196820 RepID=UPI003332AD48
MKNKERKVFSLFSYVRSELTRGYMQECDKLLYSEKHRRVSTFMQTPRELEKLMLFGFLICLDSFLFVVSFLPIRVFLAVSTLMWRLLCCRLSLEPAQICDILKALIVVVCVIAMRNVDTSMVYHMVRGQSFIKLYVIINVLEIFDRLLASIGQDTLDTLYWVALETKSKKQDYLEALFYFCVANIYVFLHTVLALFQAVTLNVAMNSHSNVLLTILISNQFVELKGNVFKKFETANLFQMSCSDIRERFHMVVLLAVVSVRNLAAFNWDPGHLEILIPELLMVFGSELFVDWVKHAFITKFNDIQPEVYRKYRSILAKDLATSRYKNSRGTTVTWCLAGSASYHYP